MNGVHPQVDLRKNTRVCGYHDLHNLFDCVVSLDRCTKNCASIPYVRITKYFTGFKHNWHFMVLRNLGCEKTELPKSY